MNHLPVEQDYALKQIINGKAIDDEMLSALIANGYVKRIGGRNEPVRFVTTEKGRYYRKNKARDMVQRWMPIIVSGLMGIIGTIAGVILGWYLMVATG